MIGQIWDSLIDSDANLSISDWHIEDLKRRLTEAEANPQAGIPWEVVKARLTKRS